MLLRVAALPLDGDMVDGLGLEKGMRRMPVHKAHCHFLGIFAL
jgi:hypothetical protein